MRVKKSALWKQRFRELQDQHRKERTEDGAGTRGQWIKSRVTAHLRKPRKPRRRPRAKRR